MNSESLPLKSSSGGGQSAFAIADEIPLTVRQAAVFLGVSPQTVYLWVERKQIPHLRVMGRNVRFFKSEAGPFRAEKTHEANLRAGLHLKKAFGARKLGEVSADDIELYLLRRLQDRVRIKTGAGVVLREKLKPATVHQELRILRRVLNVAVRKK